MIMISQIQFGRVPVLWMMTMDKYYRVNILWGYISQMKDCIEKHRFDILFKVVKLVLVLPHSNASEERVFSIVRKNKTTFLASMEFNNLGSILTVKLANPNATKFKLDKALLRSAENATWEYNKRHSSSTSSVSSSTVAKN